MADDKKTEPQEPRVEQPPEAQPYVIENKMSGEYIAPDGHVVVSKKDAKNRA